jgi:positive regulator of sigma E activity
MQERGVVTRVIAPDVVEVSLPTSESCERCRACHRSADGAATIEAAGASGAKPGDSVEVEISARGVVAASFVVYLLPVFSLIAGYVLGSRLIGFFQIRVSEQTGGILCALAFLVASFVVVRWYDGRIRRKGNRLARVTRIIPGDSGGETFSGGQG